MSKLDDVTFIDEYGRGHRLNEFQKQQIKDLILLIINTTGLIGPVHPQSEMYIRDLIRKVEAL